MTRRAASIGLAVVAVVVFGVLVIAPILDWRVDAPAAASSSPHPTVAASPSPSPSALPRGTFENPILGYRIALPIGYRMIPPPFNDGQGQYLGTDLFTPQTEQQARDACNKDAGDIPSREGAKDIRVEVQRDAPGTALVQWAVAPPRNMAFTSAQAATQDGFEAARLVYTPTGELQSYAVRANGRIYVVTTSLIEQPSSQPQGWFDDIAKSLKFFTPQPFPTSSPKPALAPRDAAAQLVRLLASAFASKDPDAVAKLMPDCSIGVGFKVDGQSTGGALNRSVPQFLAGLRERFAKGDLSVVIDPTVETVTDAGGERFFVRSEWREPDRATRVDLHLRPDRDGRWRWSEATHYYERSQLSGGTCIPLRIPWTSASGC